MILRQVHKNVQSTVLDKLKLKVNTRTMTGDKLMTFFLDNCPEVKSVYKSCKLLHKDPILKTWLLREWLTDCRRHGLVPAVFVTNLSLSIPNTIQYYMPYMCVCL